MKSKLQKLTAKLDDVFQTYVRYRDHGVCFTCGIKIDPSLRDDLHGGHVWSRSHKATRWHEDNCFAQCKKCNWLQSLKGNGSAVLKAIDRIGEARVREVERLTHTICQRKVVDLEDLIVYYQDKLEAVRHEGKDVSEADAERSLEAEREPIVDKGNIQ